MNNFHWFITHNLGFLSSMIPDPALNLALSKVSAKARKNLKNAIKHLPDWYTDAELEQHLTTIPDIRRKLTDSQSDNEMFFMLYAYFASAWVHGAKNPIIPKNIALPLLELSQRVQRPPMLAYTGMVLNNWRLLAHSDDFVPDNIELLLTFTHLKDESWFFQVHIAIEAQAGEMLQAMIDAQEAIAAEDDQAVLVCLRQMNDGLVRITKIFHEMPKHCDPDVYYQQVRPLLMSFTDEVVFEGAKKQPATPLRGGSGAQSSIVPAMLAGLGISHQASQLTRNLDDMRRYMPLEHQQFITDMGKSKLRAYCAERPPLRDLYNHVLRHLITFRRAHLYYARTYIFEKSTNPVGTGGTEYMSFLSKLIDETAEQML